MACCYFTSFHFWDWKIWCPLHFFFILNSDRFIGCDFFSSVLLALYLPPNLCWTFKSCPPFFPLFKRPRQKNGLHKWHRRAEVLKCFRQHFSWKWQTSTLERTQLLLFSPKNLQRQGYKNKTNSFCRACNTLHSVVSWSLLAATADIQNGHILRLPWL